MRKSEASWGSQTIAEPLDWDRHEQEEKRYLEAERLRLLYVAGTRAEDLLVVGRVSDGSKNKAWDVFEPYLLRVPELKVPAAPVTRRPRRWTCRRGALGGVCGAGRTSCQRFARRRGTSARRRARRRG